jgi:hypothetical protein
VLSSVEVVTRVLEVELDGEAMPGVEEPESLLGGKGRKVSFVSLTLLRQ